jgi:enoyl-CoA hydratase
LIGLGHALDLILTGRPVGAGEALGMGLANRVVANGKAREAAEALARDIAAFPQVCMRGDRLSAYEQFDLSFDSALANEFNHGLSALEAETESGARMFTSGAGRHGVFKDNT